MIDISVKPYFIRSFQKAFDSSPHILVTAEHSRPYLKHDAASTWVEDIKTNAFKVCLREMQNFDGQHKNILVVRNTTAHKVSFNNNHNSPILNNVQNLSFRVRTSARSDLSSWSRLSF